MENGSRMRPLKVVALAVVVLIGMNGEAFYSGPPVPYKGLLKRAIGGSEGGFDMGDVYCENHYGEWCFGGLNCNSAGGNEECDCCEGCVDTNTNRNWCFSCLTCGQT